MNKKILAEKTCEGRLDELDYQLIMGLQVPSHFRESEPDAWFILREEKITLKKIIHAAKTNNETFEIFYKRIIGYIKCNNNHQKPLKELLSALSKTKTGPDKDRSAIL
jgi:hypothetical protein